MSRNSATWAWFPVNCPSRIRYVKKSGLRGGWWWAMNRARARTYVPFTLDAFKDEQLVRLIVQTAVVLLGGLVSVPQETLHTGVRPCVARTGIPCSRTGRQAS